eukprot:GHRQ01023779.1.p2 GENE.GHRQ01023779.1~~GHRQ01023779.1.p2  ORF type:complete len:109 (-),score=16.38 GHRQ01023779.1:26-352(-)
MPCCCRVVDTSFLCGWLPAVSLPAPSTQLQLRWTAMFCQVHVRAAGVQRLAVTELVCPDCFTVQSLGWRTMLVVPELEQELAVGEATRATQFELKMLRNARADLDTQV